MAVKRVFPTPVEVEVGVPATRDRAIDVIRIVSLVGVVVGHTIMATSIIEDDVFIRINVDAPAALGYLNLVAWLIPGMLGVAYRRNLLAGRAALLLGGVMFAVNLALMWLGPYELSLVGIETQQLKNMTPPSLLLAGHAIMLCALAIAAAPAIARWARRPRVWWLTAIGNSGAMTLYLWHIPALLFMHLVFDYLGHPRYDAGASGFIALSILQLLIMAVLVATAFVVLRPLENNPLPLWDGGYVAAAGWRSAAVGVLLCVAGAATLASVGWGLKGPGIYCVAVMLAALIGARLLACDRPVTATMSVVSRNSGVTVASG